VLAYHWAIMSPEPDERPQGQPRFPPDQRLRLDDERAVWQHVGDEVVILDVATATVLTLNASARALWMRLEQVASPDELAAELTAAYAVPEEQAANDVQKFLQALQERSLLLSDE
jgi:Coenzyme PQQ synthesis protein D (PqqD)